ncbi:hypothetical protein CMO93_01330 [Candidatus Woesearchaeota archaeon]|nr:hypothetical protein [Candidatus Woesearchaeota archaeon]|tara:strand:+ start:1002 stop:1469 length:468 start_codon:yes stop_codon:yes gene_type:complete
MKHCPKCNKEFLDEDSFCDECGGKLTVKEHKETKKESRQDIKTRLKTPKWYNIITIIMVLILSYELFLIASNSYFLYSEEAFIFTGIGWVVFNFSLLIYFLAKKYRKESLILPITFITQLAISTFLIYELQAYLIEWGIFSFSVIGYSIYELWNH